MSEIYESDLPIPEHLVKGFSVSTEVTVISNLKKAMLKILQPEFISRYDGNRTNHDVRRLL